MTRTAGDQSEARGQQIEQMNEELVKLRADLALMKSAIENNEQPGAN